jgi:ABC-2 type transport system permease protein
MDARKAIADILSGSLVPIALYPGWLQAVRNVLPFRGMAAAPLSIYVGTIGGREIVSTIAMQLGWTAFMLVLVRVVWHFASRKLVVQGG